MRMGNEADQKIVRAAVSDPGDRLLGFLPALGPREALAFGAGVPMATRLRFKELPERSSRAARPCGASASIPVRRSAAIS